ncbi:hypothetical protein [Burkholderia cenocepacia]|nr:hypothetical protein [Burkholderia cenocepacia]
MNTNKEITAEGMSLKEKFLLALYFSPAVYGIVGLALGWFN